MRVLVVEDQVIIAMDLKERLISFGYTVVAVVDNFQDAIDKIKIEEIDIALLDINILGEKSGLDVGEELKNNYNIPFVFTTAFSNQLILKKIKSIGAYGSVLKPFSDKELYTTIEIALNKFKEEKILEEQNRKLEKLVEKRVNELRKSEVLLRNSEVLLRESQKVAHIGSYDLDVVNKTWKCSKELDEIFCIQEKELNPVSLLLDIIHPDDKEMMQKYLKTNVLQNHESLNKECRILIKKGRVERWVHCLGKLELDSSRAPIRLIGTVQDITKRKQNEFALFKSTLETAEIKNALDQSSMVTITDTDGVITYVNDKFCRICKYSEEELLGATHRLVNSGYHSKKFFKDIWKTIGNGLIWKGELKNKTKEGEYYWVDTTIIPSLDKKGSPTQYISIRRNITHRKKTEHLLEEERKNTLQAHFEGEELEKNRISKELHDGLGQILTAAKMSITALANNDKLEESAKTQLKEIKSLLNEANEETRRISRNLLPRVLNDYGLIVAVKRMLDDVSNVLGIETSMVVSPYLKNYLKNQITIYRILQESINNAIKHSGCSQIEVKMRVKDGGNVFTVKNNGKGFNVKEKNEGFGIINMKQRAESIGGELIIKSDKSKGTTVTFKQNCNG